MRYVKQILVILMILNITGCTALQQGTPANRQVQILSEATEASGAIGGWGILNCINPFFYAKLFELEVAEFLGGM